MPRRLPPLNALKAFEAAARHESFTRAAEELCVTQGAVSHQVKALEAEIGTPLFERHSRGMTLTGAGRRLLPYAQRMAALSHEAVLAARDDGEPKGPLAIGSMETTAAVRLPSLLADFHRRFPAVRLSLRTAPTADLVAAVLDGALDGAFVAGPIDHAELTAVPAFKEELMLVTARRWASLAALRAGTPESGPTALVFRTGCSYRQRLEQVFAEFGWPSAARCELGTLDGKIVTCAMHCAQFDVTTGQALSGPVPVDLGNESASPVLAAYLQHIDMLMKPVRTECIRTYETRIEAGRVHVGP